MRQTVKMKIANGIEYTGEDSYGTGYNRGHARSSFSFTRPISTFQRRDAFYGITVSLARRRYAPWSDVILRWRGCRPTVVIMR